MKNRIDLSCNKKSFKTSSDKSDIYTGAIKQSYEYSLFNKRCKDGGYR